MVETNEQPIKRSRHKTVLKLPPFITSVKITTTFIKGKQDPKRIKLTSAILVAGDKEQSAATPEQEGGVDIESERHYKEGRSGKPRAEVETRHINKENRVHKQIAVRKGEVNRDVDVEGAVSIELK